MDEKTRQAPPLDLGEVRPETFSPHVGESFTLRLDASTSLNLELLEVSNPARSGPPVAPSGDRRAPFSIVFRAAVEPLLPQSVYAIEHAKLGRLDIFIVPIGPDEAGMRYQAVFN